MSTYENDPSYDPTADPAGGAGGATGYKPGFSDDTADVGARGADNFPTNTNVGKEGAYAARSDDTGRVRQGQGDVDDLLSEDQGKRYGTRVHAFRQEVPTPIMSSSRPLKRIRESSPSDVKRESSPSPRPPERRVVTAGTKRYAPVPSDCLSSCPEYRQNRANWVARCVKDLEALNLIPERKLMRDDGLIIDWKSHVPVWSDTLKPDTQDLAATIMSAHRSNAQWHRSPTRSQPLSKFVSPASSPSTQPPSKEMLPRPPRVPPRRSNNYFRLNSAHSPPNPPDSSPSRAEKPRFIDQTDPIYDHISGSNISNQHKQALVPSKPPNMAQSPSNIRCAPSRGEEEMSEMALDYLRRYVQTFEADRASLASAYATNASFAYRVHQIIQSIGGTLSLCGPTSQSFSSGSKRTRLDITTTLLELPSLHSNGQSPSTAKVEYDMFYLGVELGMIVVCRAVISTKTVVHNFILQRKEVDVEDATIEGVWLLTATAHQILVFQA